MQVLTDIRQRPLTGYRALVATLIGAALTAACAKLAFFLPGNVVPVTMQVFAVLLCGMVLGSRLGAIAQMQYVMIGLMGAPVFSFTAGPVALYGPTGGYLIGFILAAYVTGLIVERLQSNTFAAYWLAGLFGVGAVYTCGVAWLCVLGIPKLALAFLGLDAAKAALAAAIISRR